MKTITTLEEARDQNLSLKDIGLNPTFYWAYRNSLEAGSDTLNFVECIWDQDIDPIVEACKTYGFETFTISSTFSGLITTLAEFEKRGCTVQGLAQVKTRHIDIWTNEKEILPAIVVKL